MTKMLTTPGIPRRSPIQVLTGPEVASLPRSNEIGSTQPDMVAVTQPSTNRVRGCLTSEIERDRVYSTWYGRRRFQRKKMAFSIIIRLHRKLKNANSCYKFD
ncbi:unnamed protein product [Clavelina lepadiformis]|uniref:Ribosomal protein S14 n=1 Tax=Clavelina lepadiformis TaxID=159417 RepID=A0ABP0G0K1_CLALP